MAKWHPEVIRRQSYELFTSLWKELFLSCLVVTRAVKFSLLVIVTTFKCNALELSILTVLSWLHLWICTSDFKTDLYLQACKASIGLGPAKKGSLDCFFSKQKIIPGKQIWCQEWGPEDFSEFLRNLRCLCLFNVAVKASFHRWRATRSNFRLIESRGGMSLSTAVEHMPVGSSPAFLSKVSLNTRFHAQGTRGSNSAESWAFVLLQFSQLLVLEKNTYMRALLCDLRIIFLSKTFLTLLNLAKPNLYPEVWPQCSV